jgi:chromatin-remodeling ATPase INO80
MISRYEDGSKSVVSDPSGWENPLFPIAFVALLAEKHNIWGPFVIVTVDSSEFHKWQQEIATLVPRFKVQLYRDTAADFEVLRNSLEQRHSTYTENSPLHVMVASYHLVLIYPVYFQGIYWKFVTLDDVKAISNNEILKEALSFFSNTKSLYLETARLQVGQPNTSQNAESQSNVGVARKRKSRSTRLSHGRVDGLEHLCKFVPATNLPPTD